MLKPQNDNSIVIEVYNSQTESLIIDRINEVSPPVIQIGIGTNRDLPLYGGIIQSILDQNEVKSVVIPEHIPSYLIAFLFPLMNTNVPIYYVKEDCCGLDVGAYSVVPGNLPDEINL